MDASRDEAPGSDRVPIHRLSDHCLEIILSHVRNNLLPVRQIEEDARVDYPPVECMLVCKRWHQAAKGAVRQLSLGNIHFTTKLAQELGSRFNTITALTFTGSRLLAGDPLGILADLTPSLERLELHGLRTFASPSPVSDIARALTKWTGLRSLNISGQLWAANSQDSRATFEAIFALQSLQHLSLRYRNEDLPDVCMRVGAMAGLTSVHLMCNSVPPADAGRLPSLLRELELRDVQGSHLPDSLGLFTNLVSLCLEDADGIVALPETLKYLLRLSMLEVSRCHLLQSIPSSLGELGNVKTLIVKSCPLLQTWPDSLGDLHKLQIISISACKGLPQSLGRLRSLECLKIGGSDTFSFGDLPQDIGDIPKLRSLELLHCYWLTELPPSITCLRSLRTLRLRFCPMISLLPGSLGVLTALTELELTHTNDILNPLPTSLTQLISLERCKISRLPGLIRLPEGIGKWQVLTKLEVSRCDLLSELPEGLCHLRGLKHLRIKNCPSLLSLPDGLGSLSRLEVIHIIKCCSLAKLPESTGDLVALRELRIYLCRALASLPESLVRLSNLQVLRLTHNNLLATVLAGLDNQPAFRLLTSRFKWRESYESGFSSASEGDED